MKYILFPFIIFITIFSCSQQKTVNYFYPSGKLKSTKVYSNKNDTLNYQELRFFDTGELLSRQNYVNGHLEGSYEIFTPKGIIVEQGRFKEGKREGVFQEFDTVGTLTRETYYINDKKTIYTRNWLSKSQIYKGKDYYLFKNDTAFLIGQIVIERNDDIINTNMSFCSIISSKDTVSELPFCFNLRTIFPFPCSKYEITIGTPNINLEFSRIDTSFTTTDSVIIICNQKLNPGINHIFSKVVAFSRDTATFFAYKDVFVKTQ